MHQYLKAIGFGNIVSKKEEKELLQQIEETFTHQTIVSYNEDADFCEYQKTYGTGMGIIVCGEMDEKEIFEREYYFPVFRGTGVTSYADVTVERKIDHEEYMGICEDIRVDISLIFHVQNGVDYMREVKAGLVPKRGTSLTLSGLAISGKVLFPVKKDAELVKKKKEENLNRLSLLNAAHKGDQTAIETLTLEDIDTYSKVSRRLANEDVFTIVDTYLMPYGVECDQYSILGEIQKCTIAENHVTKVPMYQMTLQVNELKFDVCVPVSGVLGEPEVGRRFKANIWLQGYINF
ncbi:MAG: DUF3881 family protein [Hespellia sp.]|jgi:hypothetical protein|nr:DUF3881 family protein [Hespellia sp.]